MPYAHNGSVELFYEEWGPSDGVPLLMIMGLSAQMISWDDSLMQSFVDNGFAPVRYDNRDVGSSSWFDDAPVDIEAEIGRFLTGEPLTAPYSIEDMADDAAAVLDAVGWKSAHILGASMGGMIAQSFAIRYPEKTRSLVSIMSTTGDPDVGQPDDAAAEALMQPTPEGREAAIEASVRTGQIIGSPVHFDVDAERSKAERAYDRGSNPDGALRQLLAILTQTSRTAELGRLEIPAIVIHGKLDPLVNPSGGQRTHEALADSELIELAEAGHDIPPIYRPELVARIAEMAQRVDAHAESLRTADAP
ncbi:MAG TPA: alpha/beta hydrolase [Acidimicrobiales bacterium]|nr:alpha/beta hydrolase [Acidimicrobiales bacterium]